MVVVAGGGGVAAVDTPADGDTPSVGGVVGGVDIFESLRDKLKIGGRKRKKASQRKRHENDRRQLGGFEKSVDQRLH